MRTYTYEVIVGNIGTVHKSTDLIEAAKDYAEYRRQSQELIGRGAGESVTLLCDGEILCEHYGTVHTDELEI